jgi:hypothetical protein
MLYMNHSVYFLFGGDTYAQHFLAENVAQDTYASYNYDFFSIEDARSLRSFLSQHMGTTKLFLIRINKILGESQNALLKICEEFTDGVLVFSFPSSVVLLDTFLSRGEVYREAIVTGNDAAKKASAFLAASYTDRMKQFDTYIKQNKDADPRIYIRELIESLIKHDTQLSVFDTAVAERKQTYASILHLIAFQKSSPKQLYEYMASTIG